MTMLKMVERFLVTLVLLMSWVMITSSSEATVLSLQDGGQVKATLDSALVSPRVGGITLGLNGETWGGSGTNHYVGPNGVWAGCYLVDIYDISNNPIADKYKSFCLDMTLDPVMGAAQAHNVLNNVVSDLEQMWATYYDDVVGNAVKAAAFQLAVWEVIHEDSNNSYALGAGNFLLSSLNVNDVDNNGATLTGLIAQANAYLDSNDWTGSTNLMSLAKEGYQPFLVAVPEPAVLIFLGMGFVGLLRRRRY